MLILALSSAPLATACGTTERPPPKPLQDLERVKGITLMVAGEPGAGEKHADGSWTIDAAAAADVAARLHDYRDTPRRCDLAIDDQVERCDEHETKALEVLELRHAAEIEQARHNSEGIDWGQAFAVGGITGAVAFAVGLVVGVLTADDGGTTVVTP